MRRGKGKRIFVCKRQGEKKTYLFVKTYDSSRGKKGITFSRETKDQKWGKKLLHPSQAKRKGKKGTTSRLIKEPSFRLAAKGGKQPRKGGSHTPPTAREEYRDSLGFRMEKKKMALYPPGTKRDAGERKKDLRPLRGSRTGSFPRHYGKGLPLLPLLEKKTTTGGGEGGRGESREERKEKKGSSITNIILWGKELALTTVSLKEDGTPKGKGKKKVRSLRQAIRKEKRGLLISFR